MNWKLKNRSLSLGMLSISALLSLSVFALSGCGNSEIDIADTPEATNVDHSHGGWWCVEHGVPEEECALCDKSLVADFKEEGDWCEEHDRPESQCFMCNPKRAEKFISRYEAKTGRKPPEPTE